MCHSLPVSPVCSTLFSLVLVMWLQTSVHDRAVLQWGFNWTQHLPGACCTFTNHANCHLLNMRSAFACLLPQSLKNDVRETCDALKTVSCALPQRTATQPHCTCGACQCPGRTKMLQVALHAVLVSAARRLLMHQQHRLLLPDNPVQTVYGQRTTRNPVVSAL